MWFEVISGLKKNITKSDFIPIVKVENVEELAFELSYKVGELPTTYLGFPLGASNDSPVA